MFHVPITMVAAKMLFYELQVVWLSASGHLENAFYDYKSSLLAEIKSNGAVIKSLKRT